MEDIFEVYKRPFDPSRPVVGMDETTKQLVADVRIPIAAKPGYPQKYDVEYHRCGVANIFMFTEPLGSWLNVAEIELSVLSRQCLHRRIESMQRMESECASWNVRRNGLHKGVDWQFITDDARIKLKRLYPQVQF